MSDVSTRGPEGVAAEAGVLDSVFRSSAEAIVLVDQAALVSGWNSAAARMFGVPRKRALGRPFEHLFSPDWRKDARKLLLTCPSSHTRRHMVGLRGDGSRLIVEVACSAVRGTEKKTSTYVVVLRDVTEPVLVRSAAAAVAFEPDASAALESFSHVLRQVVPVDNLTLTAFDGEKARRVASCGRCAKKLPSGEILSLDGTPLGRAVLQRKPLVCHDTRAGGLPYDAVLAEHGVNSYVVLPLFHGGRVVATLNVGFAASDAPTAGLVKLLASLTSSIMPIVLNLVTLEAQDGAIQRLERLDAVKNEFLALIAHDIQTPLLVINGFADELQNRWTELPDEEKRESIDIIVRNGRCLYRLVEEQLELARIESGQFTYELGPVALEAEVQQTVADLGTVDADRVRVSAESDMPLVLCDPDRHRQVLTNLLSNALRFSPSETTVRVELTRQGRMAQVAVRDRGPGIDRTDRPKLFEKFSRLSATTQFVPKGTGLGLYIAKAMVEGQGGSIRVQRRRGGGSTFIYTLPVAEPDEG
jgi:PAS domain S-box-containing protein